MARTTHRGGATVAQRPPVLLKAPSVSVSYPKEKEIVSNPTYTVQVAVAGAAAGVEISINQGEWQPCRESLGLWWYDWNGYETGEHEIVARLRKPDGKTALSDPRIFEVKLA